MSHFMFNGHSKLGDKCMLKIPFNYYLPKTFKKPPSHFHQAIEIGDLDSPVVAGWNHASTMQKSKKQAAVFEEGSRGVEIYDGLAPDLKNGDVGVSKHWSSRCEDS